MKCYHCEHYDNKTGICDCDGKVVISPESDTECDYLKEPLTNGDKIRAMSNEDLVKFVNCSACIYAYHDCANQDCTEGMLSWLNAPAESEVNNGSTGR